ncbi:CPBP family intramembrane metalloprotease [Nocardioides sp. GY 10113]|uniref:CPBP family intramembrane glutamic endopeptidase n=1 Tax=Nocardioides sp. GY 10113 TaxID=2569761 RepID=UPI0010A918D4|nr:CPBP family intramembrane glutamic endopeptidase [Nocardioides sp. GY 10113]TIC87445.1 CPBP family intramembrane metalloprotease [Nocardioides sp. GY 10113]
MATELVSIATPRTRGLLWTGWVVAGLLLLPVAGGGWYLAAVGGSAALLALLPGAVPHRERTPDRADLAVIALLYVAVVALERVAFVGFGTDRVAGLFLFFAAALLVGVAGPVVYTVAVRRRGLADLGLRRDDLRSPLGFALLFGGVQFALTLWGYDLPAPVDWVPLLVMSLVVGVFESIFFRGFVQTRLEAQLGTPAGVGGAAVLYGAYHVGYGMGGEELLFLTGLGVVYAVAFALARHLVVLWPLLTPLGSFYANLEAGDIDLPWASILGFVDVLALMAVALWLTARYARRAASRQEAPADSR